MIRMMHRHLHHPALLPRFQRHFFLGDIQPVLGARLERPLDIYFDSRSVVSGHFDVPVHVFDDQFARAGERFVLGRLVFQVLRENQSRRESKCQNQPFHFSFPIACCACCLTAASIFESTLSACSSGTASFSFKSTSRSISATCTSEFRCLRMDWTTAARITGLPLNACSASIADKR